MSKVKRNEPKRSKASASSCTWFEFEQLFPDDASCLDFLVSELYPNGVKHMIPCPKCGKETRHHRVRARPAYACQFCGHHEYPMVGTIFEGSATSLRLWFFAMYTMASTRCGVSAKQLERELGVTYKTAWRMFHKIRSLMDQGDLILGGTVEVDETFVGGRPRAGDIKSWEDAARWRERKAVVAGAVERGGKVTAKVVPDTKRGTLVPFVQSKVLPASTVYTDEWASYNSLGAKGYAHDRVSHSQKVYVSGDVHTQTIEGFWSLVKRGIGGVYHSVSTKHLQSYLDEYAFGYNNREAPGGMFSALLGRIEKAPPEAAS